jgi:hypothetical protein
VSRSPERSEGMTAELQETLMGRPYISLVRI